MIIYFLNKQMNVIGLASNVLNNNGMYIHSDSKEDDIKTGSQSFEFTISYNARNKRLAESCTGIGNGIIIGNSDESYVVTDTEQDWFAQEITVYAESAGLNLINTQLEAVSAPSHAQNFKYYFDKFFGSTEWNIGINELADETKKLEFDEESGTARLQNLVSAFGGELGYSFEFVNNKVTARYINIYQSRGSAAVKYLHLGKDIETFIIRRNGSDLVTAIKATGKDGINLKYKSYDDGNLYLENGILYSRSGLAEWGQNGAHIIRSVSYDTNSTANLLTLAKRQLAEWEEPAVSYEAKTAKGFTDLFIGDNVIIQDLTGRTAYRTRVINVIRHDDEDMLEVTFGEYAALVGEDAE